MPGKGKFARCVESVSRRGGVSDPRAVCAKSIAGKRGRTRGRVNATQSKLFPFVSKRAARKRASSQAKRMGIKGHGSESEKHYRAISELIASGMSRADAVRLMGNPKPSKAEKALLQTAGKLALLGAGGVPAVLLAGNKAKRKKNPGTDAADAAYREFHGRDPEEVVNFESTHHFPKHTAAIGDLIELSIRVPKERMPGTISERTVDLSDFGEAWLTRHPRMKQLYVEGGDQSVDLEAFGLDSRDPHEVEYLGELVRCVYFTRKDHLGDEGGTANYHHRFGKNELTLDKTELIKVGYHVPDEQLLFVGGGYEIPAEGIDG